MRKITHIIPIFLLLACSRAPTDIPSDIPEPPSTAIVYHDSFPSLDTSAILANENLDRLTELIEKAELKVDTNKSRISPIVYSFLKRLTPDSFSLANSNERWQVGCVVMGCLPKRKMNYLGQSKTLTVLTYETGGWGTMGHIIVVEHNDKTIIDFWSGLGHNLNNKDSVLKHLKRKEDLNSNFIYL